METITVTFNELRRIKDALPDGSIHKIADLLDVSVETVRNYFGGENFERGKATGLHYEKGPEGGIVTFDDATILQLALKILDEHNIKY
ncbi:MAG: DNA-binding protein [Prevotellaceae bacterium]|jgi:predicted transcriptional regulator|nr:DNA-binding protein [Prevotellaceae bacterium]